jgi:D-alanyl-lipoteichoic acid acyltransferase DltB (MBOAT superfamily)
LGVTANVAFLAYFKYASFIAHNANLVLSTTWEFSSVAMPLAVSFFTFQQIAYLVDLYRGDAQSDGPLQYAVFLAFFPKLLSGPIVRYKEMAPDLAQEPWQRLSVPSVAKGLTLFAIGLYKKVIIADGLSPSVAKVFSAAEEGQIPAAWEAWGGALGYTFQLYFDFSGYVDMALGLALLFGFTLPPNFESPYKSNSISDFWRRWHITLSYFLRDYLYIPLGGSRKGRGRRYVNLVVTMTLAGLWHGAGWTFVLWGALHGVYLVINRAWRDIWPKQVDPSPVGVLLYRASARTVTFLSVVVAWVLFRARSLQGALAVLRGMIGANGTGALPSGNIWIKEVTFADAVVTPLHSADTVLGRWFVLAALVVVTMVLPNSNEIARRCPSNLWWALLFGVGLAFAVWQVMTGGTTTEFLYFDF